MVSPAANSSPSRPISAVMTAVKSRPRQRRPNGDESIVVEPGPEKRGRVAIDRVRDEVLALGAETVLEIALRGNRVAEADVEPEDRQEGDVDRLDLSVRARGDAVGDLPRLKE